MLYVVKSQDHYLDHLEPIVEATGLSWCVTSDSAPQGGFAVVASGHDASRLHPSCPYVYVEHGAGQTYEYWHPSHSGSIHTAGAKGIIVPGYGLKQRFKMIQPYTPVLAAGCPKLDPWHRGEQPIPTQRTVAITFHWDCNDSESKFARWAFPHYKRFLHLVVDEWRRQGWFVIGHGHPRVQSVLGEYWSSIGVEFVPTLHEVFDRAHVLVADNTSALPEFMSLGRPVIMLNAPWYNRSKHVGNRFWEWSKAGIMVDDATQLADINLDWYVLEDTFSEGRAEVVSSVYAHTDGRASERAGAFVRQIYEELN